MDGLQLKYFVLNPTKDDEYGEASKLAILSYADSIKIINPDLARDLSSWVNKLNASVSESQPFNNAVSTPFGDPTYPPGTRYGLFSKKNLK